MMSLNICKMRYKLENQIEALNKKNESNRLLESEYEIKLNDKKEMLLRNVSLEKAIVKKQDNIKILNIEASQLKQCVNHFEGDLKISKSIFNENNNKMRGMVIENNKLKELSEVYVKTCFERDDTIDSLEGIVALLKFEMEFKKNVIKKEKNKLDRKLNTTFSIFFKVSVLIKRLSSKFKTITMNYDHNS